MDDLGPNVLSNVLANLITTVFFALVGVLVVVIVVRLRRRKLQEFFGLTDKRSVRVFLSTIAVNKEGTTGTQQIKEGFYGDAITELEYRYSLGLVSAVTKGQSSWLFDLVLNARGGDTRITSSVMLSVPYRPLGSDTDVARQVEEGERLVRIRITQEPGCVVLVGGPIYNLMTYYVLQRRENWNPEACFEFIRETDDEGREIRGIRDVRARHATDYVRLEKPAGGDATRLSGEFVDYFVVEKTTIGKNTVFICAGTCTSATAAALELLRNWRKLHREFGNANFSRLYQITSDYPAGRESDPSDVIELQRSYPDSR